MTVGTSTFMGLALPLHGEAELKQDTAATDFITLTGDSSISGDFLVCRTGSTEVAYINSSGKLYSTGFESQTSVVLPAGIFLKLSGPVTTAPTDMGPGELRLVFGSTQPQIVACYGTTSTSLAYFTATTATLGL